MGKGGGKPKGRPRKMAVFTTPQLPVDSPTEDVAESSKVAESRVVQTPVTTSTLKQKIELEIHSSVAKQEEIMKSEMEKEVEARKIEDGDLPQLRRRGLALNYVTPVMVKGTPTAQLLVDEIENEANKWKFAVILYFIGESPTISYLRTYLRNH